MRRYILTLAMSVMAFCGIAGAARVTVDYDRRYSTPAWTGDQLVESIVATLPPPEGSPAAGRNGRQ